VRAMLRRLDGAGNDASELLERDLVQQQSYCSGVKSHYNLAMMRLSASGSCADSAGGSRSGVARGARVGHAVGHVVGGVARGARVGHAVGPIVGGVGHGACGGVAGT